MDNMIEQAKRSAEFLAAQKSNPASEIEDMKIALKERDAQIKDLKISLKERDAQIQNLQAQIDKLEARLAPFVKK
jgi:chromosome segregation ATPase